MLHRRFPKLFSNSQNNKSKSKSKEEEYMESKSNPSTPTQPKSKARPRPRLDRINAAKNIDYTPTPRSCSASNYFLGLSAEVSASTSSDDSSVALVQTRSIDVYPWGDRTSFRIDGKQEGDFDFICKSLGFSSPDDLGISPQDYDAMKARQSPTKIITPAAAAAALISDNSTRLSNVISPIATSKTDFHNKFYSGELDDIIVEGVKVGVSAGRSIGVGIKGQRPPAVLLSPPPRMTLPVFHDMCSSYDILKSFGPQTDRISIVEDKQEESTSDDEGAIEKQEEEGEGEGEEEEEEEGGDDEVMRRRGRTMGKERGLLYDSCSFTSNSNDDDSSSTTTDPMSISPNGRLTRQISSWDKGKHLGSGSYGSVYEGIADGGFFFAVKEVSLLDQGDKGREIIYQLEQEMAFLSQFQHKNIVQYLGTDKDDSNLYIFLELVSQGSLLSLYQRFRFQDSHVSGYTRQILEGLMYLHERNVVHRDIKCANILLDVNGYVKLADFGLAKVAKLNDAKSCKGTSYWMAPEVVKPNQWYGRAADIWSLGCTVLELLTQNFPYHPLDGYQAMFQIGSGQPPPVPDFLSRDARDFILKCLQVDPDTRPSAADLLEHPFVKRPHLSSASPSPHHHGMRA